MTLRRVRIELARDPDFPEGSPSRGYEFVAPLAADGALDAAEWSRNKDKCTVRRFWQGEEDRNGYLSHEGTDWLFDYDRTRSEDDEPVFRLDRHSIVKGEYLSIDEHDGDQRTFRVVRVE